MVYGDASFVAGRKARVIAQSELWRLGAQGLLVAGNSCNPAAVSSGAPLNTLSNHHALLATEWVRYVPEASC